jgi:hypothetical protein
MKTASHGDVFRHARYPTRYPVPRDATPTHLPLIPSRQSPHQPLWLRLLFFDILDPIDMAITRRSCPTGYRPILILLITVLSQSAISIRCRTGGSRDCRSCSRGAFGTSWISSAISPPCWTTALPVSVSKPMSQGERSVLTQTEDIWVHDRIRCSIPEFA